MIVHGLLCLQSGGCDRRILGVYSSSKRAQAFIDAQPPALRKLMSVEEFVLDRDPGGELWEKFARRCAAMAELEVQVERIIGGSKDPRRVLETKRWVNDWLTRRNAMLEGRRPEELLDTAEGRLALAKLIGRMHAGVYS